MPKMAIFQKTLFFGHPGKPPIPNFWVGFGGGVARPKKSVQSTSFDPISLTIEQRQNLVFFSARISTNSRVSFWLAMLDFWSFSYYLLEVILRVEKGPLFLSLLLID